MGQSNSATAQASRHKLRLIYGIMFAVSVLLVMFSWRWQVIDAAKFQAEATGRSTEAVIPALRGSIYAKDGTTLAYSEPRYDGYIWLPELEFREQKGLQTRDQLLEGLAPILDTTPEALGNKILGMSEAGLAWIKIGDGITLDQRNQIIGLSDVEDGSDASITGYDFVQTSKRIYPEGQLASQILGLTNSPEPGKTIGQGGLEGEWDGNLEPISGYIGGERDAKGNAIGISTEKTIEAIRGDAIYTSIDKHLQKIVEDNLKWAVEQFAASSGSVVIMDPHSGEVMAMANFPTYDPNLRDNPDPNVYGNKGISEPYEIGSVGKIFTLAAALDSGAVTPDTVVIQGHNGCERIHDDLEPVCTHDKLPQPPLPIKEAFALSDNIYFLHTAQLMEPEAFYDYLVKFGIGKPTGIDLKGESFGYLKDPQRWNIADIAAYSYGHSYQVNLLQATSAVAAVANGGVLMQPHVVTKVERANGESIIFEPRAIDRVIKQETSLIMDEMMHTIYQNNIFWWEGHYADLKQYKVALKSGTALIPYKDRLGYSADINATYAGYDASPDRTFAMLVRLERPQGSLASTNARVLWLEIFRDIKDYLGIKPT